MKPPRVTVTVRHADGTEDTVEGRVETFESPRGTILVDCVTCPVGPRGERTGFFVDVLDARLSDGPFHCDECRKS